MPDINVDSLLSVLKFTTTILLPKYPHSIFPLLSTYYIARHRREKKTLKLELWSVPEDAFACLIPESAKPILLGNVDSSILVSFNTLQTLGVNSCSWLKLKKCPEEIGAFDTTRSYLAYIIAIPDIEDSVAVVTNVLHYNITQALLLVNNIVQAEKLDGFELFVPHIATLAKVSLLQPLYDVNIALDAVLSCYFQHPCFLRKGDVFCIDLIKFASAVPCLNSKVRTLCFKVLDIEGPCYGGRVNQGLTHGYYVMKLFTSLVQCTDQQGYVPQSDVAFIKGKGKITGNNLKLQLLSTCPAGLDEYRDELLGCVQPHVLNMYRFKLKPLFLLCGPRGVGKVVVARNVAQRLGLNVFVVNSFELQGGNPGYTEGKLKHVFTKVQQLAPCILLLRNIEVLCRDKDGTEDSRSISAFINEVERLFQETRTLPVLLVATCNSKNESTSAVPPALARVFLHVVYMQSPNKLQRTAILQWLLRKCNVTVGADLSHVADQTSGFLYADLAALVFHTVRYRFKHLKESCHDEQNCVDVTLRKADFEEALDTMHAAYSEAIDAPKIPKVSWDDVGGLSDVKKEIMRTIMLPLQHPELLAAGLQRSGILLYGPPGTGKTLLAKAVATEFNLNFLSVKGPELLNMYVGQSEENVREVFNKARAASPCVIFFDELDSLAPNRGKSGDSGGVMDRVVSQLLSEIDGLQKSSQLFVIGATNRSDLIDRALLRPGRFDKLLYVGVPEDKESQLSIMVALTRRFHLKSDVDLKDVVSLLPDKLTGADLYSLCSHAWLIAVRTQIHTFKHGGNSVPSPVEVGMVDFREAINSLPSVKKEDYAHIQQIQDKL